MSQVQQELDEIVQLHDDMTQTLAELEKMEDMGEFMLKKMELGQKLAKKDLLERRASKFPDRKWSELDKEFMKEVQEDVNRFQAERKRVGDSYMAGKDPLKDVTVKRVDVDDRKGSIFSNDEHGTLNKREMELYKILETYRDVNAISRSQLLKGDKMTITDESDKTGQNVKASEILYSVYNMETKIFGLTPTQTQAPTGPVSLPDYRKEIPAFKGSVSKIITQNQLLYTTVRDYSGSYGTVQQFTGTSTVVKSEPKYMCLWCNEKRKEELNNLPTDPVLSKN